MADTKLVPDTSEKSREREQEERSATNGVIQLSTGLRQRASGKWSTFDKSNGATAGREIRKTIDENKDTPKSNWKLRFHKRKGGRSIIGV